MNTTEQPPSRNPWPIAIVAYFVLFIAFIAGFTVFATRQKIDLVSQDYYDKEIHFQDQIDRLNRTRPLAAQVAVDYSRARQQVSVTLPAGHSHRQVSGRIRLYRPSDAGIDQTIPLAVNDDGIQIVDVSRLRDGLWKVRVQWAVDGEEYCVDQPLVVSSQPL
jgi:nitrogen fixation protein FixH